MVMDCSGHKEGELFFESLEEIVSSSHSGSEAVDNETFFESLEEMVSPSHSGSESADNEAGCRNAYARSTYDIWKKTPCSIQERRQRFFVQMGLANPRELGNQVNSISTESTCSMKTANSPNEIERLRENGGAVSTESTCSMETANSPNEIEGLGENGAAVSTESTCSMETANSPNEIERLRENGGDVSTESTSSMETANSPNEIERLGENGGAALRIAGSTGKKRHCKNVINIGLREGFVRSSSSSNCTPDAGEDIGEFRDTIFWECMGKIKKLNSGKEFAVDELEKDGLWNKIREVETDRQLTMAEFERSRKNPKIPADISSSKSPKIGCLKALKSDADISSSKSPKFGCLKALKSAADVSSSKRRSWLKALKSAAYSMRRLKKDERDYDSERSGQRSGSFDVSLGKPQWTKVSHYRKRYKEFTTLYMGQEIEAHKGSVWTMKFSLDGRYLASAGQDRVIHVREVIESTRTFGVDTPDTCASCAYFSLNGLKEIAPLRVEDHAKKLKTGKIIGGKKSSKSDSLVLPNKVFKLSEKPVSSFHGHLHDVFDLSWSPSHYLLSSSMDKTVRLWKLGHESCLKVFSHNDIVTCIQFNAADERYFISGSLDGKARIWSIPDRRVVGWTDLREMVTAVCYTPDGQGALVGSIKGSCRFYNTTGNMFQLENQVSVCSKKKKSSGKKITGFQFAPGGDSHKVLITSADSRVRVYDGSQLVCKYKGFQNTCSQISASFAPNGKHLICASEDSHVYIWNHESPRGSGARHEKSSWSHERFLSQGVSVAIPWSGMKLQPPVWNSPEFMLGQRDSLATLQEGKDVECQNGLHSRKAGEAQESETGLHYVSQVSRSCGNQRHSLSSLQGGKNVGCQNGFHSREAGEGHESETGLHYVSQVSHSCGSQRHSLPSLQGGNDVGCQNGLLSREAGEGQESETALHYVSQVSNSCGLQNLVDRNGQDDLSRYSACISDSRQASFMAFPASPRNQDDLNASQVFFSDRSSKGSAIWPEEKLPPTRKRIRSNSSDSQYDILKTHFGNTIQGQSGVSPAVAWGLVIVTASREGEIRSFQNYGLPVRL